MKFLAGSGCTTINPEIGTGIAGQLYYRVCRRIHDNLEANGLFLTDGKVRILLISCDLLGLDKVFIDETAAEIQKRTGIPADCVIIACTHSHNGPYTDTAPAKLNSLFFSNGITVDSVLRESAAYLQTLRKKLIALAGETVASAKPARIGWGLGQARIGHNRRVCWGDGSHTMYRDETRPDFTGLEGPDDPSHAVFFAADARGRIMAVVHNNTCHPGIFGTESFASSDYPGAARTLIRKKLGKETPVIFLQGASGDISLLNLHHRGRKPLLREKAARLAGATLRLISRAHMMENPVLGHLCCDLKLALRCSSREEVAQARRAVQRGPSREDGGMGYYLGHSLLELRAEQRKNPHETIALHALRIGDVAIVTNPFELFCQFGLDLKRRSPARMTVVSEVTGGYSHYCPTSQAILGRGFSAQANYISKMEPYAGYIVVERSAALLYSLWNEP